MPQQYFSRYALVNFKIFSSACIKCSISQNRNCVLIAMLKWFLLRKIGIIAKIEKAVRKKPFKDVKTVKSRFSRTKRNKKISP